MLPQPYQSMAWAYTVTPILLGLNCFICAENACYEQGSYVLVSIGRKAYETHCRLTLVTQGLCVLMGGDNAADSSIATVKSQITCTSHIDWRRHTTDTSNSS